MPPSYYVIGNGGNAIIFFWVGSVLHNSIIFFWLAVFCILI